MEEEIKRLKRRIEILETGLDRSVDDSNKLASILYKDFLRLSREVDGLRNDLIKLRGYDRIANRQSSSSSNITARVTNVRRGSKAQGGAKIKVLSIKNKRKKNLTRKIL